MLCLAKEAFTFFEFALNAVLLLTADIPSSLRFGSTNVSTLCISTKHIKNDF